MKRKMWTRIPGGLTALLVLFIMCVILYLRYAIPSIPLKEIIVQSTAERMTNIWLWLPIAWNVTLLLNTDKS